MHCQKIKNEVLDYIDFPDTKYHKKKKLKLTFDWEGGLSDLKTNIPRLNYNIKQWSGDNVPY